MLPLRTLAVPWGRNQELPAVDERASALPVTPLQELPPNRAGVLWVYFIGIFPMVMPICYATGPRVGCRANRPQDTWYRNTTFTREDILRSQQFCRINVTGDIKR